jgi:hypothetical protein
MKRGTVPHHGPCHITNRRSVAPQLRVRKERGSEGRGGQKSEAGCPLGVKRWSLEGSVVVVKDVTRRSQISGGRYKFDSSAADWGADGTQI